MSVDRHHPIPCLSCGALIFFAKTAAGRMMPLDADTVEVVGKWTVEKGIARYMGIDFQGLGYQCHWSTCPEAAKHRRHHARQK